MIKDKIIKIASQVFEIEANENTAQDGCSRWDSLRHLNFIIALEEAFDISFEPEEIATMTNIEAIYKLLLEKIK